MTGIGKSEESPAPPANSLGVIISLPPALAAELGEKRAFYAGAEAAVVPPHITLVSGQAADSWDDAAAHVRKIAAGGAPFMLSLRGTGTFEPISPVVFLNVAEGAQECAALHQELVAGPVEHLLKFGFHPHLTIAHDLDQATLARAKSDMNDFCADFEVTSIGLFDYLAGGWFLREELSLGGGTEA